MTSPNVAPSVSPRVLVVEHEDKCPPALFGGWLTDAGCTLDVCRPYAGEGLPKLDGYDALLVLGGPMGANDDAENPWLGPVKDRVRDAVGAGVPTLGICLGHQLIAVSLGGTVDRNPRGQQIGVLDVGWTAEAAADELMGALATPRRGVQWNNDIVTELPEGATLLATTPAGEPQAVRFAPSVWGVQLHPEADGDVVRPWAESDRGSHEASGIDQDALLRDIDASRDQLDEDWQPLAARFAALAAGFAERRR